MSSLSFYLSWIVYNILIVTLFYRSRYEKYTQNVYIIYMLFFVALGTTGFITADYFSYRKIIDNVVLHPNSVFTHIEPLYIELIKLIKGNYYLFRFIIMSGTFYFIYKILRGDDKYGISILFFYAVFCLHTNISGRQALANYMLLFGVLILYNSSSRLVVKLIKGGLLVFISLYLHKSNILFLPLLILLFIPISKRLVIWLVLLFPFFVYLENILLGDYFKVIISTDISGVHYLTRGDRLEGRNVWWKIISFASDLSVLFILMLELWVLKSKIGRLNKYSKVLYAILFWISYEAFLFYFLDIESDTIFRRTLAFVKLPMVFFLPLLLSELGRKKYLVYISCLIYFLGMNIYILGVSFTNLK